MKHLKKKLIAGILLLLALTGVFGLFLARANVKRMIIHRMEAAASVIETVSRSLETDLQLSMSADAVVGEKELDGVRLTAAACRKLRGDVWDGSPMLFMDGAVITVSGKEIRCPQGLPADLALSADLFTEDAGTAQLPGRDASGPLYTVSFCRVDGPAWYIEWESCGKAGQAPDGLNDFGVSFADLESAFGTNLLIIDTADREGGDHPLLYRSDRLPDCATAEELGITGQMLSAAFDSSARLSGALLADAAQTLTIGGQRYELFLRKLDSAVMPDAAAAYLIPYRNIRAEVYGQLARILAVFAAVAIVLLVWLFSARLLVRRPGLSERQREEFSAGRCWRRILGLLGVAAALMLAATALLLSLFRLFSVYQQVDTSLLALELLTRDNRDQPRIAEEAKKKVYEDLAARTAGLVTAYPDRFGAEDLQGFCDIIGADYIMLFDSGGDETLSNSDFAGLRLGTDPSSATYEFRLLLNGVPAITHDPVTDEQTRLSDYMFGARTGKVDAGEGYGALLMAVAEDRIASGSTAAEDVMDSLASDGMLAFSVDPGSGTILHASDPALTGAGAVGLGLPEEALRGGFQDFFKLDGLSYYGKSEDLGGNLCFYASESSRIYNDVPAISLVSALLTFFLLLILSLYMMRSYRKDLDENTAAVALPEDPADGADDDAWKYLKASAARLGTGDGTHLPRRNAAFAARILLLLCVAWVSLRFFSAQTGASKSLLSFIILGQWTRGFNLFAITGIFLLFAEVAVAVMVLKLFIRVLSAAFDTRGETVCRLLMNLLSCGGVIIFVYFALYDLGFSPGTLLSSLGLLSFAISLGAQEMISDILAGLSIVFGNAYRVGDIIRVGDYRGEVLEIGIRATRLEERGGNIKIISNRDIKSVVNLTCKNSWYLMELRIPGDQPLDRVEALLDEQLPRIGQSIPEIISGPYYKGVLSIGQGGVTLSVITECREADYLQVQRAVNRAILELFAQENIQIL